MDLVDGDRAVERLPLSPGRHPLVVAPGELGEVPDDRRRLGAKFGGEPVRVGLLDDVAVVAALDLELVDLALAEIGDEQLPDSGGAAVPHRMPAAVPVVEVAGHADAFGIGGPDGEVNSPEPLMGAQVGTQPLVVAEVRSFAQEVKVEIGQHRPELVRIDNFPLMPLVVLDLQAVHERLGPVAEHSLEKPVGVQPLHGNKLAGLAPQQIDHPGRACFGQEGPDHPLLQSVRVPG